MFLKRLEVVGFKSFASRTSLDLDSGIAVIVGPNGSGKSNLADAIRWVLGEQSMRAVRGKRSEDVIFAGSSTRPPLGMAEVSLVLDNGDECIPLPFSEVRLTRRLYRSGESEYLINGRRVRLRDIIERLTHAGLGSDTYCVISQGAVDELILQRPEERRVAFESAAGIRRYQLRLAETRSRLESAEQNLTRCQDVMAELEPHLRRLRSQAERAERAARLDRELKTLARQWFRRRLKELREELERADQAYQDAERRRAELEAAVAEQEASWQEVEQAAGRTEQLLRELRPRAEQLRAQRETLQREAAVAEERVAQLARRLAGTETKLEELRSRAARLEAEVAAARQDPREGEALMASALQGLASARERLRVLEQELARRQTGLVSLEREHAQRSERRGELERRRSMFEARDEASRRETAESAERLAREEQLVVDVRSRLDAERERVAVLDRELQAGAAERATLQQEQERMLLDLRQTEQATLESARRVARLEGMLGQPTPGEGRSGIATHDLAAACQANGCALVRGGADLERLRERERSRLAANLAAARDRLRALELKVSQQHGVVDEIAERVREMAARVGQLEGELGQSRRRVVELEHELGRREQDRSLAEERLRAARHTRAQLQRNREVVAAEDARGLEEVEALERRLESERAALKEQEQEIISLRGHLSTLQTAAAVHEAQHRSAREMAERVAREARDAERALERALTEQTADEQERGLQEQALANARARLAGVEAELGPLQETLAANELERQQHAEVRHRLEETMMAARRDVRTAHEAHEAASLARERARDEFQRVSREALDALMVEAEPEHGDWPMQLRLALKEPGPLQGQGPEDGDQDDAGAADFDMASARRRINSLQRELRAVGAVDAAALGEYREMAERYEFLGGQSQDLRATIAELRQAIADLESLMAERFSAAFERVNEAFQQTFAILFDGGSAQLILTRPEHVLESGVDVVARPPGKRLQGLMSLSGGERALTSVALLFALLSVNPTPFVLLDEVDAALDESNVQRFADLLKQYAKGIQFIVVTHNRATMEIGTALFGVSMETDGVSKVLSLRLAEAATRP